MVAKHLKNNHPNVDIIKKKPKFFFKVPNQPKSFNLILPYYKVSVFNFNLWYFVNNELKNGCNVLFQPVC